MSFTAALSLVRLLEGGKWNDPKGGATNQGMTQQTFRDLGFAGDVMTAADAEIAGAYRMLWDALKAHDPARLVSRSVFEMLPEPADSVAFQWYINAPVGPFVRALQGVLGLKMDGDMGCKTFAALAAAAGQGERQSQTLSNKLLTAQEFYYRGLQSEFEDGLLARVMKVKKWLVNQ